MKQILTLTPTTDADRRQAKPWTVDEVAALFELPFNDLRRMLDGYKDTMVSLTIKRPGVEEPITAPPRTPPPARNTL